MRVPIAIWSLCVATACAASPHAEVQPGTLGDGAREAASTESVAPTSTNPTPEPADPAPEASRFAPALEVPGAMDVSVVDDDIWAWVTGSWDDPAAEVIAYELRGAELTRAGEKRIPLGQVVLGFRRIDGAMFFATAGMSGRTGVVEYFPLSKTGRKVTETDANGLYYSMVYRFSPPPCGEKKQGDVQAMLSSTSFEELPDKTVAILGVHCDGSDVIQIVDPVRKSSRFIPLAEPAKLFSTRLGLVVAGKTRVAILDGEQDLMPLPLPELPKETRTLEKLSDGTFLAGAQNGAFLLSGERWVRLALPDGSTSFELRAGATTIWAFADVDGGTRVIYKYVPPGGVAPPFVDASRMELPAQEKLPSTKLEVSPPGPRCPTHVVVLYGFTKVTPDDYDFPLTRQAIKGHTELDGVRFVVTEAGGKKFFVAKAPSFDKAKQLATVIEKGVSGSKPQVVCADPKELRELAIDLRTGAVLTR